MLRVLLIAVLFSAGQLHAAPSWNDQQRQIIATIEALNNANHHQQGDIQRYASLLTDNFSRWTIGSQSVNDKSGWVNGVSTWRKRGWALVDFTQQIIDIEVIGDWAFSSRITTEAYIGPDKKSMLTTSALAEVWRRSEQGWQLMRMTVQPMPNPKQ